MELELELKLARVADEFTSADLQIAKDRSGPLFLSRETDTMFILTVHLRGYRKRNIKIEINEDGTLITISGEKAVQETVMVGWRLHKKETEIRGFRKGFKIPDGVILDKIKAKFDEDESILTISMPKKEKGIRGVIVEEVKEHELARGGSETLQIDDHDFPREKIMNEGRDQETEDRHTEENEPAGGKFPEVPEIVGEKEPQETAFPEETQKGSIHDLKDQAEEEEQQGEDERLQKIEEDHECRREKIEGSKSLPDEATQGSEEPSVESTGKTPVDEGTNGPEGEIHRDELAKQKISQGVRGNMEAEQTTDKDHGKENDIKADKEEEEVEEEASAPAKAPEVAAHEGAMEGRGRFKICTPIVAGSALLLSIVVFVFHFIRTKSQPGKRKD